MAERTYGFAASATFTPAAAAYSANDVIATAQEFTNIGPISGGPIMITTVSLEVAETALQASEAAYRLHLYSVTPPSAPADNAAWDLPSGDRVSYRGFIEMGTPVDLGSTLYVETTGVNKQLNLPASVNGGSLFGLLVTIAGFTATATARKVKLHAIGM